MTPEPRSTGPLTFSLGRLMSAMIWLAVAFAILRYCEHGPDWLRYAVVVAVGSAAFGAVLGLVVQRAARRQEESPWGSPLATTGLLIATLAAVAVLWSIQH